MIAHINIYSKQVTQKSAKPRNTITPSTHIVTQIIIEIFLKGALSPQHLTF